MPLRQALFYAATGGAPLLSVLGGKVTTYRRLAERVMAKLAPFFPALGPEWTAHTALPGGALPAGGVEGLISALQARHPGVPREWLRGLVHRHGERASAVLGEARIADDLGTHFGGGLTAREVDYLVRQEWAVSADDILWRRTKVGLRIGDEGRQALERYLGAMRLQPAAARANPA